MVKVSMWSVPFDKRNPYKVFKVRDMESAKIFMEKSLSNDGEYEFKDVNDATMYYNIMKDKNGNISIAHTKYGDGLLPPIVMEYDDVEKKIYNARKSINNYFFGNRE